MQENRLFTISEIRECERFTMQKHGISSLQLMEQVGVHVRIDCITKQYSLRRKTCMSMLALATTAVTAW